MQYYNKNLRQAFLVASVTALTPLTMVYGQSHGTGPSGADSGYFSGSAAAGHDRTSGSAEAFRRKDMQDSYTSESTIPALSDHDLRQRIRQALWEDQGLSPYAGGIDIEVNMGAVTLRGPVKTEKDKADIGAKAQRVGGVREVNNQLQVAPNLGGTTGGNASSVLEREGRLYGTAISADDARSSMGSEQRTTPDWPSYRTSTPASYHLYRVAAHQRYQTAEADPIVIRQDFSSSEFFTQADRDLVRRVRENLNIDPAVSAAAANVQIGTRISADQGTIVLQGSVPSERERERILAKVQQMPGVERIDNQLRVTGAIDPIGSVSKPAGDYVVTEKDRDLASRIRLALIGNPDVSVTEDNIHLKVDNGEVTLHGWVNSEQERAAIAAEVRQLSGVRELNNQLQVRAGSLGRN